MYKIFLRLFLPPANTTSLTEKALSGFIALLGIGLIMFTSQFFLPVEDIPWVVASMGPGFGVLCYSRVLVYCVTPRVWCVVLLPF